MRVNPAQINFLFCTFMTLIKDHLANRVVFPLEYDAIPCDMMPIDIIQCPKAICMTFHRPYKTTL